MSNSSAFSPNLSSKKLKNNDENTETPSKLLHKASFSGKSASKQLNRGFGGALANSHAPNILGNTPASKLNSLSGSYRPPKVSKKTTSISIPSKQPCLKRQASMSSLSISNPKLKKANSLAMLNKTLSKIGDSNKGAMQHMHVEGKQHSNTVTYSNHTVGSSSTSLNTNGIRKFNRPTMQKANPTLQKTRSFDISSTFFGKSSFDSISSTTQNNNGQKSDDASSSFPIQNQGQDGCGSSGFMMQMPDRFIPASTNDKANSTLASVLASTKLNNKSVAQNITEALKPHSTAHTFSDDSEEDINQSASSIIDSPPPPANASPETHLKSINKKFFQKTVAQACGIDANQRILQYLPKAPLPSLKRSQSYSLENSRNKYTYDYYSGVRMDEFTNNSRSSSPNLPTDFMADRTKVNYQIRKINQSPERILDCPEFFDDFYLNLIAWNKRNVLAIALNQAVYLWNGDSGDVLQLLDYSEQPLMKVTSVTWSDDNFHISVGFEQGFMEVWDTETMKKIRKMHGLEKSRIGVQSWLCNLIASGNKDGMIKINDVRVKNHVVQSWDDHHHGLEVCGLAYRSDGLQLASGGNDNSMIVWDTRTSQPQFVKRHHQAAVKALSWNPDISTLLASGGGSNDQKIHFWNTSSGIRVNSIDTGTQISSLHWGQSTSNKREIVATGGEPKNAISVYNYENRLKVAEIINAHESKIISSQLSPDETTLCTIGGDENLKFFKVFDSKKPKYSSTRAQDDFIDDDHLDGMETDGKLKSPHKNITIR
ncbi:hypothetical protein ACO0QE_003424 [Hanseniaspora vineae]